MDQKKSGQEVVQSLISHLIDNCVRTPPYIGMVSKRQLWWGNGVFKDSKYPRGLMNALDIKNPKKKTIEDARRFYGYDVMKTPFEVLNGIINSAMRSYLINETLPGGEFEDLRVIMGMGYIMKDGTLDPQHTKGISCYVIFSSNPNARDKQNEWIKAAPDFVRLQIARNMDTHQKIIKKQLVSAMNKQDICKKLLKQVEYKQLSHGVKRSEITWELGE